jgi:energy-coupling factor transport system ATP-binding protein
VTILLRDARYRYPGAGRYALQGIDLQVRPGRIVGLIGPNEAGKSTLCLVASGLAPSSIGGRLEGSVTLDGAETARLRPHECAVRCGILFQEPTTQLTGTTATVYEEVAFGPRNLGLPLTEVLDRVEWAMDLLGIEALATRDPARLSGGEAQLVALASVLALRPTNLVLDEPTSELDPLGTRLVGEAIAGLAAATGLAVLLAEHKTDLLARIADQVIVLDGGRVALAGPADQVLDHPALPDLGVEPPSGVRLARALERAGFASEAVKVER